MMTRDALYDVPTFNRHQQQWDDRDIPLQYSHAERQNFRACPVARPERMLSSRETESESGGTTTRRRIAVACARCRKRKIKCSGDPGNGMGCQNCRTAGAESCNFYRVNSYECAYRGAQPLGNLAAGFSSAPNLGMVGLYQPPASYPVYSRPYPHGIPLSITTRTLSAAEWPPISDCDSPTDGYALQSPAPITGSQPYSSAMYGVPSNRACNTMNERSASINSYMDKEQSNTALHYLSSSAAQRPSVTTDGPSSFNVGALQSSLPRAPAVSRQLPVPTMGMRQMALPHNVEASTPHVPAGPSSVSRDQVGPIYHSGGHWAHENYPTDYRNSSFTSSAPATHIGPVPSTISTATSNTSSTSPQSYTETSSSHNASPTALTSLPEEATPGSVTTPSVLHAASALSNIGSHHSSAAPSHVNHRNASVHNLSNYQYSPDRTSSLDDLSSGNDTLSNGQRYEPIVQPQPERITNVQAIHRESWEQSTAVTRQASLTGHDRSY